MKTTEEKADIPISEGVEEAVRERLETVEQDRKKGSPWPDAMRRVLSRQPAP